MKSIDTQIAAMASRWPGLDVVSRGKRQAIWEGIVAPEKRHFRVRISYTVPFAIENLSILQVQPRVQVLNPILERHPEYEDGPIPHIYVNQKNPSLPFLCLFDPYNREWSTSDLIADTTVPWTARYLYFYEGWLLTGKWLGGGRHPSQEELVNDRQIKTIASI